MTIEIEYYEQLCSGWVGAGAGSYRANESAIDRMHGLWMGIRDKETRDMIDRYADVAKARRDDLRGGA